MGVGKKTVVVHNINWIAKPIAAEKAKRLIEDVSNEHF